MANVALVYGMIEGATWTADDYYKFHAINQEVINKIPLEDKDRPFINRSMFSIPNDQGIYRHQLITIGGSYQNLHLRWSKWLEKFEEIISEMYWFSVVINVNFEFSPDYKYEWYIDEPKMVAEYWENGLPIPKSKWGFESTGPRQFDDEI